MVTFLGKAFDNVDAVLNAGSAVALGRLLKGGARDEAECLHEINQELRRLAVETPDFFDKAYALGRMAGEINCVWHRVHTTLANGKG